MKQPFFHFDKGNTFCISLHSAHERWSRMMERFNYFEMDVTRWYANRPDQLIGKFAGYMNPGQRACAQSHANLWKYIVSEKIPYALILEDDACFDRIWFDKLHGFNTSTNTIQWDAIFLNVSEPVVPTYEWTIARDQYLTGGYIISLEGAKKILSLFPNELWGADWMTTRLQTFGKCWTYFPWLIVQEGLDSTIGSGVDADHAKVVRCLDNIHYDLQYNYV
jgi:GR25 family glycosyltransferase involved in LPS biosynthesis